MPVLAPTQRSGAQLWGCSATQSMPAMPPAALPCPALPCPALEWLQMLLWSRDVTLLTDGETLQARERVCG